MNRKLKWISRILSIGVLAFGLPFYFGYGNPLPFIDPDYTLWDNIWLTVFPIMFLGLIIGLVYQKVGGYLIVIPISLGQLMAIITEGEIVSFMLIPLIVGILYLIIGYKEKKGGTK